MNRMNTFALTVYATMPSGVEQAVALCEYPDDADLVCNSYAEEGIACRVVYTEPSGKECVIRKQDARGAR